MATELGIEVVPLSVTVGGQTYRHYLDEKEISFTDFYRLLRAKNSATTSAPNTKDFTEYMEEALKNGKDVLYIGFSSALSATYSIANMVAKELAAKYPKRKIYLVNSLCASLGEGLLVYLAALEKGKGKSIDEVFDYVEKKSFRSAIGLWLMIYFIFKGEDGCQQHQQL